MKFHVGKMNKVVRVEANTPVAISGTAAKYDDYDTLLTTKGYLKDGSGGRSLNQGEVTIDNRTELLVRYQAALWDALNSDQYKKFKVVIDDRPFTVQGWNKIEEKIKYIRFYISEQR